MSFVDAHLASLRKDSYYLREVAISLQITLGEVHITLSIHNLKTMFQVDALIALIVHLQHRNALNPQRDNRHDELTTVEIK